MTTTHQVAIVGGGPAGLQAALTLGRMHVETVLFDDARYRNETSARMHNVLGWDGATPAELRATGRAELTAYPCVRVLEERVSAVRPSGEDLVVVSDNSTCTAEHVLVASGVEDALLPIPGMKELWGELVLPCPYCHGHEFAPGPIAVISSGGHAEHIGGLLRGLSDVVPVIPPEDVASVARSKFGVTISMRDGSTIAATCVFIPPGASARSALVEELGVRSDREGIIVDALGRTSHPAIWAAGDVAKRVDPRIPAAILTAMAAGLIAAADIAASVAKARDLGSVSQIGVGDS